MGKFKKRTHKEDNIYKKHLVRLVNYVSEPIKKPWVVLKTKLRVFLKPRIIVN